MVDATVSETEDGVVSSSLLVLTGDYPTHFAPGDRWNLCVEGWDTDDGRDTASEVGEECQPMNTDPEEHVGSTEDSEIDQLLLAASQDYEAAAVSARETEEDDSSTNHRFGAPVTSTTVEEARKSGVPLKTRRQTSLACGVWSALAKVRKTLPVVYQLEGNHVSITLSVPLAQHVSLMLV